MLEFIHQKKISDIYMTYSVDIVAPVLLCGDNIFGVVIRNSLQVSEFSFDGFLFGLRLYHENHWNTLYSFRLYHESINEPCMHSYTTLFGQERLKVVYYTKLNKL